MKKYLLIPIIFLAVFFSEINRVVSYSSGAPAGFTGSPFDGQTCATYCHYGTPEIPQPGIISSNIPPSGYIPGNTYTITASIVKPGHTKFGFQISPMDNEGNVLGSMNEVSSETQIIGMGTYITHSGSGNTGSGSRTWSFDWDAPTTGTGDVTFYGAFNASNNNSSNDGDSIFTSTLTVAEDLTVGLNWVENNNELLIFPNPVSEYFTISLHEIAEQQSMVKLFDAEGKLSYTFNTTEGSNTYKLPENTATGIYYLQVNSGEKTFSKKIIVL